MEVDNMFGVDLTVIYNVSISQRLDPYIAKYQQEGRVQVRNWEHKSEKLENWPNNNTDEYNIQQVCFPDTYKNTFQGKSNETSVRLFGIKTLSNFNDTAPFPHIDRSKYIVNPRLIFDAGLHYVNLTDVNQRYRRMLGKTRLWFIITVTRWWRILAMHIRHIYTQNHGKICHWYYNTCSEEACHV